MNFINQFIVFIGERTEGNGGQVGGKKGKNYGWMEKRSERDTDVGLGRKGHRPFCIQRS